MSFATALAAFAKQSARERQTLSQASVQPYTGDGYVSVDGSPVNVFLSAWRRERMLSPDGHGFIEVEVATLRVLKTCRWQPVAGSEAVLVSTDERFRCGTATGATSDFAAEIVCDVTKISG